MPSAMVGRAGALTVTMTTSCGPRSDGRSVATGYERSVPSRVSTRNPFWRMAANCSPRAIRETSAPLPASRPAICPPTAPAPYMQIFMFSVPWLSRLRKLLTFLFCGGAEEGDVVTGGYVAGTELEVLSDQ